MAKRTKWREIQLLDVLIIMGLAYFYYNFFGIVGLAFERDAKAALALIAAVPTWYYIGKKLIKSISLG